MRSTHYLRYLRHVGAVGLAVTLAAGCGAITGEHLSGTGGQGPGGAGGAPTGVGGQGGGSACVCNAVYAPVCGTNGVTYPNSCGADCAGVAIAYQGACADGGATTCNSDSDCMFEPSGCCSETCASKEAGGVNVIIDCNIACPVEIPPPVCACVNHQCVTAGGAGGTGGTGGATGSGGSGAGDAGLTCGDLAAAYADAMPAAEQCDVNAKATCQTLVSDSLSPCGGCSTYVNDASTLNAIQAAWLQQKCNDVAVLCPAISCLQPTSGLCVAGDGGGGRCQISAGVFPN